MKNKFNNKMHSLTSSIIFIFTKKFLNAKTLGFKR